MTEAEQFWDEVECEIGPATSAADGELNTGPGETVDAPREQGTNILTHQAWDGLTEVL